MNKINVFVTGVGGGGHGEQILKALKMAKTSYNIIGGDISPYSKGLFEVENAYILPLAKDPGYIDALLKVCKKHKVKALFHGSEPELKAMSANREILEAHGLFVPINPSHVIEICMDKVKLFDFLKSNGFHSMDFHRIGSPEDLENFDTLPVVLKPSIGSGGSANTFLAQNREELLSFGHYLLSIYPEFITQEYIGTPDCEYTVGVLTSMSFVIASSVVLYRGLNLDCGCFGDMAALQTREAIIIECILMIMAIQILVRKGDILSLDLLLFRRRSSEASGD